MNLNAVLALALLVSMFLVTFLGRLLIHYRTTGSCAIVGLGGPPGSIEWWGRVVFEVSLFVGTPASALLELTTRSGDVAVFPSVVGALMMTLGIVGTATAQGTMGTAWRIGVDSRENTLLVTHGFFRVVRNPIYTSMLVAIAGLVVLVPNPLAFVTLAAIVISVEIQVRLVEEPHLLAQHGADYARYANRVGRFCPGIGRLRA